MLLHGGEPRRWSSRRQLVRGFRNLCRVLGAAALFMPPSEGQEPRALTVAAQAIEGRKCAETAKVHPDLRIVCNLAYGVLAGEAGRFSLVGDYTTKLCNPNPCGWDFFMRALPLRFFTACNRSRSRLLRRTLRLTSHYVPIDHSDDSASACCSTVCTAASCKSGG